MSSSSRPDPSWTPVVLDRAHRRSVRAISNGCDYEVSVSVPPATPPAEGFPLLVVLDGPALFATVAETERRLSHRPDATGVRPTVIVGVGPAGESLYDSAQRQRDFTPGPSTTEAAGEGGESGGAAAFLEFLRAQILPMVEDRVAVDRSRTALFGHSLAGYFTLDVLATEPELFAAYGAVSPSIWWSPDRLTRGLGDLSSDTARVLLAVGEREQPGEDDDPRRASRRMVDGVKDVARLLKSRLGDDRVQAAVLPDEDHASVVNGAATRMLRLMHG